MSDRAKFVHVNLVAKDWRRLAAFYQHVFGCILVPPERNLSGQWLTDVTGVPNAHIRGAHLRLPGYADEGPTLEIFQYDTEEERPNPTPNRQGLGHIAFVVDDVNATGQAVLAAGGKYMGKTVSIDIPGAGKIRLAYLADPEGNIIELQQPASAHLGLSEDTTIAFPKARRAHDVVAPFTTEPMQPGDWPQIRAIYLDAIAAGQATLETEAPQWEQWDAGHLAVGRLVARAAQEILGWAALSPASSRRVYEGVAEVSVYVGPSHRWQGVGTALLTALIAVSEQHGIWTLQAGVLPENAASMALFDKCGFRQVGRRERLGRLRETWRDVLLLERRSAIVGTE